MRHSLELRVASSRRGMSLVEVILVIIAILILLSLILPSIDNGRGRHARRLQCLNNLKNLGLAVTNYASGHDGKLPLLAAPAPGLASAKDVTWVMSLFPYLDRADTHEYIMQQTDPKEAGIAVNTVLSQSYQDLQCPNDVHHFKQPGGLSFGANIGYGTWRGMSNGMAATYALGAKDHGAGSIDWNLNGILDPLDKEITRATGVFWFADDDEIQLSLDDVNQGDGTSQTILLAESLNVAPMHLTGPAKDGMNPGALEAGIGLGLDALGIVRKEKPTLFVERTAPANIQYTKYFKPSGTRDTAVGGWPRSGSFHPGGVNVVFADGHTAMMNHDINWAVWASLHTPSGTRYGEAKLNEADF